MNMEKRKRQEPQAGASAHAVSNPLRLYFDREEFKAISQLAKSSGLNSYHLQILCSWIESKKIDEQYKLKFIECLIPEPNGTIPENLCIRLSYLLMASHISSMTKVELLKWMICARPFMETDKRFNLVYEMMLELLRNTEMRSYIALFLSLITQKKHVTYRRVQYLIKCVTEYGNEPSLNLLKKTYFTYAPDYFNEEFEENLETCQFEPLGVYPSLIRKVHSGYKPNFSNIIITTTDCTASPMFSESGVLSEKSSEASTSSLSAFQQIHKEYKKLESSNNISKILKSKHSYLFLTSNLNTVTKTKIEDYIISMLHEAYDSEDIVEKYSEFHHLQDIFPGLSEFNEFLLMKDVCNPDIVEALCYQPICCFKKIQYKLDLVRGKFLTTDDIELKCQWLNSLSRMLCYWILQAKGSIPCDGTCNEEDSDSSDTPLHHIPSTEISQLASEIDFLCDSLIMEDSGPLVLYQILKHYQMSAFARTRNKKHFNLCFPSAAVFQLSLFSLSPSILETLSEFMLRIFKIHTSQEHPLKHEESMLFQAACNDIKKVTMGGAYKTPSTYLSKSDTFKKMFKRNPEFPDSFILYKHPALFLATLEFDVDDPEKIVTNALLKKRFCTHLAENGNKYFAKLISKIK